MKKILFLAAGMIALVGCNRSGTGGYGENESGASSDTTITAPAETDVTATPAPTSTDTNQVETSATGAPATSDQGIGTQPADAPTTDTNQLNQGAPTQGQTRAVNPLRNPAPALLNKELSRILRRSNKLVSLVSYCRSFSSTGRSFLLLRMEARFPRTSLAELKAFM